MAKARPFDHEVKTEFIKHMLGKFTDRRYHEAFVNDISEFRYRIEVEYDIIKLAHHVRIRSMRGFEMALLVAEDRLFEVDNADDWMLYQLQRMEPMMDTLMFIEWFYMNLPHEDQRIYRDHLAGQIKQVSYIPPRINKGPMYRTRFCSGDGKGDQIAPDWLAVIRFENGATRRETIQDIQNDMGTWLAMMLMVVDNKELAIGNT